MNITENELLEALQNALTSAPESQDGFTTKDVETALGVGSEKARRAMKALLASGRAETVRLMRPDMFGHSHATFGVRLRK